jgi:hypothetical protein
MRWTVVLAAGFLASCGAELEPVFLKHEKTGNVVKCGPYPVKQTFAMSITERRRCVDFYKNRGHVETPAPAAPKSAGY